MGNIDAELTEEAIAPEEADAALPLSAEAGWNQTAADWRFMLRHGRGVGVRDESGQWVGSSLALPLGAALSWISMVLVAKSARRHGIGTRLLRRCIEAVRTDGRVAGLDATELGHPVYLPLGFRDVYPISRLRLESLDGPQPSPRPAIRPVRPEDLPTLAAFDEPRSALRRGPILAYLCQQAPNRAFMAEAGCRIVGYVLGRPGRIAFQVGPLVAEDEAVALALLGASLAVRRGPVMLDMPDEHRGVHRWLAQHGAVRERGFVRMTLGEPPPGLAESGRLFAIAGPELG